MIYKFCLYCNKRFKTLLSETKRGKGKYCSNYCNYKSRIGKPCSKKTREKIRMGLRGIKNCMWKGGRFKTNGYILILMRDHPHLTDKRGYVFEHRFIVEKYLGRYLDPRERVHHINKIKNDNRLENLFVFDNKGTHLQFHKYLKKNPILKDFLISNLINQ